MIYYVSFMHITFSLENNKKAYQLRIDLNHKISKFVDMKITCTPRFGIGICL